MDDEATQSTLVPSALAPFCTENEGTANEGATPTTLFRLPYEIRLYIFNYLTAFDLKNIACCNTHLKNELAPRLYRHLDIPWNRRHNATDIANKLDNLKHTKSVVIRDDRKLGTKKNHGTRLNYKDILLACANVKKLKLSRISDPQLFKDIFLSGIAIEELEACYFQKESISPPFSWKMITRLHALKKLTLYYCMLTDADLRAISKHAQINDLSIDSCDGFTCLESLSNMVQMTHLVLYDDGPSNLFCNFKKFQRLVNLVSFKMSCLMLDDDDLDVILSAVKLTSFELVYCRNVTHLGFNAVKNQTSLRELRLCLYDVTSGCVSTISELKALNKLYLSHCENVTDSSIEIISGTLVHLTSLNVDCTEITDSSLEFMLRLPLVELTLNGSVRVTDTGMSHIKAISTLRHLEIMRLPNVSDEGLDHLSSLRLDELKLTVKFFSIAALQRLCRVSRLKDKSKFYDFECTLIKVY